MFRVIIKVYGGKETMKRGLGGKKRIYILTARTFESIECCYAHFSEICGKRTLGDESLINGLTCLDCMQGRF